MLRTKTQAGSITPDEVGSLHEDTLAYIAALEQSADSLGIKKVYPLKSAMEADTTPVGNNGKAIRHGQLVCIYDLEHPNLPENGDIYIFQSPGWILVGNIKKDSSPTIVQKTADGKNLQEVYELAKDTAIFGKERVKDEIDAFDGEKDYGFVRLNGSVSNGDTNWVYTDFVSLENVKKITYTNLAQHSEVASIAYYDSKKSFISKVQSASGEISSFPEIAGYVRFCKRKGSPAVATLHID